MQLLGAIYSAPSTNYFDFRSLMDYVIKNAEEEKERRGSSLILQHLSFVKSIPHVINMRVKQSRAKL